jgi:hypothetical protein
VWAETDFMPFDQRPLLSVHMDLAQFLLTVRAHRVFVCLDDLDFHHMDHVLLFGGYAPERPGLGRRVGLPEVVRSRRPESAAGQLADSSRHAPISPISMPSYLRPRNLKVCANLTREEVVHLAVAGNRRTRIVRDGVSLEVHRDTRGARLEPGDEIHLGRAIVTFVV